MTPKQLAAAVWDLACFAVWVVTVLAAGIAGHAIRTGGL